MVAVDTLTRQSIKVSYNSKTSATVLSCSYYNINHSITILPTCTITKSPPHNHWYGKNINHTKGFQQLPSKLNGYRWKKILTEFSIITITIEILILAEINTTAKMLRLTSMPENIGWNQPFCSTTSFSKRRVGRH